MYYFLFSCIRAFLRDFWAPRRFAWVNNVRNSSIVQTKPFGMRLFAGFVLQWINFLGVGSLASKMRHGSKRII